MKSITYHRQKIGRSGDIMIFFLGTMVLTLLFITGALRLQGTTLRNANKINFRQDATYLAEAGLDKALESYKTNTSYTGETFGLGNGTVVTTLTTGSTANEKVVTATATVYGTSRRVRAKIATQPNDVAVAFRYAMQAGTGGIIIGNNTQINGNLYSNENITGSSNAVVTGSASAVGTITNVTVSGQKKTGQAAQTMPAFDQAFWKAKAQAGQTITGAYTPTSGTKIGPAYINGSLTIGTNILLTGPVYVSGAINFNNGAQISVDNTLGSDGAMLISESALTVGNNSQFFNNSSGGYLLLVSTDSSDTAITVGNSNAGQSTPLYAPNGGIVFGNSAHIVAVSGRKINFGNNTVVNYDSGLASAEFSSGPGGTWNVQKGSYQEY